MPFKVIIIHNKTHYLILSTCTCWPLVFKWVCCRRRSFGSICYYDFTDCGLITAYFSLLSVLPQTDVTDVAIAFVRVQYCSSCLLYHLMFFDEFRIVSLCTICDAITIHILLTIFLFWIIPLQSSYGRLWCQSHMSEQAVSGWDGPLMILVTLVLHLLV